MAQLAQRTVADIPPELLPLMAACAAELTVELGLSWRISGDEAAVALIRIITRAGLTEPTAGGEHTVALLNQLMGSTS